MSNVQRTKSGKYKRFHIFFDLLCCCCPSTTDSVDADIPAYAPKLDSVDADISAYSPKLINTEDDLPFYSPKLVSSASQCDNETDFEENFNRTTENFASLSRCSGYLDLTTITDPKIQPLENDMRLSLEKLDTLIKTLDHIYKLYSKESAVTISKLEESNFLTNDSYVREIISEKNNLDFVNPKVLKTESLPLLTPFTVPCVQISTSDSLNDTKSKWFMNENKNVTEEADIIKNYTNLPSSLGTFTSTVMEHITTIKTEIDSLKNIFYNIKCVVITQEDSAFSIRCDEIQSWFEQNNNTLKSKYFFRAEEYKFFEAKKRASNFCKFFRLARMHDYKIKKRRKAVNQIKLLN